VVQVARKTADWRALPARESFDSPGSELPARPGTMRQVSDGGFSQMKGAV
jgi:hypothetical protein